MIGNRKIKRRLIVIAAGYLLFMAVGILTVVVGTGSRKFEVAFKDGGSARIEQASMLALVHNARCIINITSKKGKTGNVTLGEGSFDSPLLLIPTTNSDVFFCVYDFDVDIQLLRIDLNQPFTPLSSKNPMRAVVIASTCGIERVRSTDDNDWAVAGAVIQEMPSYQYRHDLIEGFHCGWIHIGTSKDVLVNSLHHHGDQGIYESDTQN